MEYDKARVQHIASFDGLREVHGKALILSEAGYSRYGIAEKLSVTDTTARKYMDELQEVFGFLVLESEPKTTRFLETYPEKGTVQDY